MSIRRISLGPLETAIAADATILVPNSRIRDALLHAYAQRCDTEVFRTPKILGIDVWVRRVWDLAASHGLPAFAGRQPISSTEESFLWMEIIEAAQDRIPLLNPEETARAVSHAYQLLRQWQLEEQQGDVLTSHRVIPDIAVFLDWKAEFEAECERRQLISLADCLKVINRHCLNVGPLPLSNDFCLYSFLSPPPLYADLFASLEKHHSIQRINPEPPDTGIGGKHFKFGSLRDEISACCEWVEAILSVSPNAHIGIVGELDESRMREVKRRLNQTLDPQSLLQFDTAPNHMNSSQADVKLNDEALIHDGLLLLGLIREEQLSEEICRLLRSPFLLDEHTDWQARSKLERHLRRQLADRCQLSELQFIAGQKDKDYYWPEFTAALTRLRERMRREHSRLSPLRWSQLFAQLLAELGWPGSQLSNYQQRVLEQWQEVLQQFAQLTPVIGAVDINKALASLRSLVSRAEASQKFMPAVNLSLYSLEEAAGLEFDYLWLLNMNDQVWPPSIAPSPFLPFNLQRDNRMPASHSEVQYEFAVGVFTALCKSVSTELRSSHHQSDDDEEFRPSSFVANFEQFSPESGEQIVLKSFYGKEHYRQQLLIQVEDDVEIPLEASTDSLGGHQVLSNQSSCPFRAFALHRLGASPLQPFSTGLSKMARGSAMHIALEYLFKNINSQETLTRQTDAQIHKLCEQAAEQAVGYLTRNHKVLMTPRFQSIEVERTTKLLQKFLTAHEAEAGRSDYRILELEKRHHWIHNELHFNLVVDRVDELADGTLAVIDYKTGKSSPTSGTWLADRPEDLQIPFYFTAMAEMRGASVKAVALAHVNAARIDYTGLSADSTFHGRIKPTEEERGVKKPWSELTQLFTSQISRFSSEFKAGLIRVDPANGNVTCRYCELAGLCRIDEAETGRVESLQADSIGGGDV